MERLVDMQRVSASDLDKLLAAFEKAQYIKLHLHDTIESYEGGDKNEEDTEHDHLEIVTSYTDGDDNKIECSVDLRLERGNDGELSKESMGVLVDILCPYMKQTLTGNNMTLCLENIPCGLGHAFMQTFCHCRLTSLIAESCFDFCDNDMSPTDLETLKRGTQYLEYIYIETCDVGSLETQETLLGNLGRNLKEVHVLDTPLNSRPLQAFLTCMGHSPRFETLQYSRSLYENSAEDLQVMGRVVVANLPQYLGHVDISYNDLTDLKLAAFLNEIGEREQSLELNLQGNTLGVACAVALGRIFRDTNAVSSLQLSHVSNDAAVMLFDSLHQCTSLETLMIEYESTTIEREGATAMGRMLQHNESISDFNVSSNALDADCTALIFQGLARNRGITKFRLVTGACGLEGYRTFGTVIAQNNVVKELELRHNSSVTQAMAREVANSIGHNRTLTSLTLSPKKLEDGVSAILLDGLASNHSITTARLENNGFTQQQQRLSDHYLLLNQFGRRYLVDPNHLPMEVYPWILAKTAEDIVKDKRPKWGLDVLSYVVCNRPEVYDVNSRL